MKKYVIPYSFNVTGSVTMEVDDDVDSVLEASKKVTEHLNSCKKVLCGDILSISDKGNIRIRPFRKN